MEIRERPVLRSVVAFLSGLLLGAFGLGLGTVLMAVAVLILVPVLGFELTVPMQLVLSLVFIQGVGCAGVAATYVAVRPYVASAFHGALGITEAPARFGIDVEIPDLRDVAVVGVGYVLALGAAFTGAFLVSLTQAETGTNQAAELAMESPEVILLLVPASILIIGPGEEALFRGVVQGRMREVFDPIPGVFIPSLIFAAVHWFALSGGSPEGNLLVIGVLLGPALVFGASYEYTGNIVVPSLIHGFYNATLFTLLYVVIKFADQLPDEATTTLSALL